jgi:hypothetical protein
LRETPEFELKFFQIIFATFFTSHVLIFILGNLTGINMATVWRRKVNLASPISSATSVFCMCSIDSPIAYLSPLTRYAVQNIDQKQVWVQVVPQTESDAASQ